MAPMSDWHRILRPLRHVRRRLRLMALLDSAVLFAVPAGGALLVGLFLLKIKLLDADLASRLVIGAAAVVGLGALLGAARRIPLRRAARILDRSAGLEDRLGSALEFGPAASDPFERAAVSDALQHLHQARPQAAAPLRWPRDLRALGGVVMALALLALVRFPEPPVPQTPPPPRAPTLVLDADEILPERDLAETLLKEAQRHDDQEIGELGAMLQQLLDDLEQGRLTHEEAFEKLATIERRLAESPEGEFEPLLKDLKALGEALAKERPTKELGEALKAEELALAQEELKKIAQRLKEEALSPKEQKALATALERRSKLDHKQQEAEEQRRRAALEREERRLRKALKRNPTNQDLKKRLKKQQRRLQRLTRKRQQRQEQRRRLQRLARQLQRAAQQLSQRQQQQAGQSARQASRQVGRFANEIRRGRAMKRVRVQVAELKETVRRARPTQQGGTGQQRTAAGGQQGQQGQGGKDGKDGKGARASQDGQDGKDGKGGKNGKGGKDGKSGKSARSGKDGKGGKGGKEQSKLARFYRRAKGRGLKDGDLVIPDATGDVNLHLPGQGQEGMGDETGPPGSGQDRPGAYPGDGIGDSHDPNLLGKKTRLRARHRNVLAPGKQGAGPTRAETILSASDRGFSSRSYRKVYRDYTTVVEEVMHREKVPLGFKHYVKRYYRLIMPRE